MVDALVDKTDDEYLLELRAKYVGKIIDDDGQTRIVRDIQIDDDDVWQARTERVDSDGSELEKNRTEVSVSLLPTHRSAHTLTHIPSFGQVLRDWGGIRATRANDCRV